MRRISARLCSSLLIVISLLISTYGAVVCFAQTDDVLCRGGNGKFEASFHQVKVHVGAARSGGLATRTCEASLTSDGQDVTVASGAWEIDLDAFGVDLGIGGSVASFQVKQSESDCCTSYLIYSLQKPPRLLRTITGGSSFRASDADFDGRVEVWTDDAAALEGFENLTFSEPGFLPPVVLRFEQNRLLDAGSEFQPIFDQLISKLKGRISSQELKDFKSSDGKLAPGGTLPSQITVRLRAVKIGVLEIAWSYLNSGREHEAWAALADMWPATDVERIRAAIIKARDGGIHAQVEGVATVRKNKRATIYDITKSQGDESEVVGPQPILLRRPPPAASEQGLEKAESSVVLIIDSAGKVHLAGGPGSTDADLIAATRGWKFIPAQRGGHAVACRTRLAVSARR
jgi:hypothetical protein